MEDAIIEKQELRGLSAAKLGEIQPEQLTFGSNTFMLKVKSKEQRAFEFNTCEYEIFEDLFCPIPDMDSSIALGDNIYELKLILPAPFEVRLWSKITELLNLNKKQKALYTLFDKLNDQLDNKEDCNNFLIYLLDKEMSSDIIVHVLNALSPIKEELPIWDSFMRFAHQKLIDKVGVDKANRLLKVVL